LFGGESLALGMVTRYGQVICDLEIAETLSPRARRQIGFPSQYPDGGWIVAARLQRIDRVLGLDS
jgi:hypothetical protein